MEISNNDKKYLKKFKLDNNSFDIKDTLKEILNYPPAMVLAKAVENAQIQMNGQKMVIVKGNVYCFTYTAFRSVRKTKTNKIVFEPYKEPFSSKFNRYTGQDLTNKKLLIYRTGGLGDIIFTQSVVKQLKDKYPSCIITYSTIPSNLPILTMWDHKLIDRVTPMPFTLDIMEDHDYHLTFEGVIERCKEAEIINCYDLYNRTANLEFDPEKYNPVLKIDIQLKNLLRDKVLPNTVALQMRASSILRSLHKNTIKMIVDKLLDLGFNVGFLDSPPNSMTIDKMIKEFGFDMSKESRIQNFSPEQKTIAHGAAILDMCIGAITTDSAFSHISAGIGKPCVTIFGPFNGDLRTKYYKKADWIGPPNGWNKCGKHPCHFHDDRITQCAYIQHKMHPGCMTDVNVDDLISKFLKLIEGENNG